MIFDVFLCETKGHSDGKQEAKRGGGAGAT